MSERIEEDVSLATLPPRELQMTVLDMTRRGLLKVANQTRVHLPQVDEIVSDVSSQVMIAILSNEIASAAEIATRIRTICFQEVNHLKRNVTGKDLLIEMASGDDLRDVEDVSDESMNFNREAPLIHKYQSEDKFQSKTLEEYRYFMEGICGIYRSLKSDFLKKFFIEWLINKRDGREIASMIRMPEERRDHVSVRRVRQCKKMILDHVASMIPHSKDQAEDLLLCANTVLKKLAGQLSDDDSHYLEGLFHEIAAGVGGFNGFQKVDLSKIPKPSNVKDRPIVIPELLADGLARERQVKGIMEFEAALPSFYKSPEKFCVGQPMPLHPHQYEKLVLLAKRFVHTIERDRPIVIASIAPPGAGKTYIQAVLARLTGLPFVFVTNSNAIIYGSDGAMNTFQKLFPRNELGIVNHRSKEFGRKGTLTTYTSFTNPAVLNEILAGANGTVPLLFLLDEGDLAQTDLRQEVLQAIQGALHHPIVCLFSATTKIAGKHLGDVADVVDTMELLELIRIGEAKHVLGFYVDTKVTIKEKNLIANKGVRHVDFTSLKKQEQEVFISIPTKIILENHRDQRGIVHCMSVRHAERLAKNLSANGIRAACVSGKTSAEIVEASKKYINGELQVLTSCDVLGRGYSEHGVTEFVIFADITSSETNLYHKIGRGFRRDPENNILVVYQLLPTSIRAPNFAPVVLSDIFPLDHTREIKSGSVHDMRNRLSRLIDLGKIEFVGSVGEKPITASPVSFTTEMEVRRVIDTRTDKRNGELELTENNLGRLLFEIVKAFADINGKQTENLEWMTTGAFFQKEVLIQGKKLKGSIFLFRVLQIVYGPTSNVPNFRTVAVGVIKEWFVKRHRPDKSFIDNLIQTVAKEKEGHFQLTEKNVDKLFLKIVHEFADVMGVELGDYSWINTGKFKAQEIEIDGRRLTALGLLYQVGKILTQLPGLDRRIFGQVGIRLVREWCIGNSRPSKERALAVYAEEQTAAVERVENTKQRLKLSDANIGNLFVPIVDKFVKALGGEPGDLSCIKTGREFMRKEIELDGQSIQGERFLKLFLHIVCGVSYAEANKFQAIGIKFIRQWYETGKRPKPPSIAQELDKARQKRAAQLQLTPDNIDNYFSPIVDIFIEAAGKKEGDYEWINSGSLLRLEAEVDGKKIKSLKFVYSVVGILYDLPSAEAANYRALGVNLIREWYRLGKRPSDVFLKSAMEQEKLNRESTLEITEENVDEYFPKIMDALCVAAGREKGDCEWMKSHTMEKVNAVVENKSIRGLVFMGHVTAILCQWSVGEALNHKRLGLKLIKQWYMTGKRPNKKFVDEAKKHELQTREGKLRLTADNAGVLFMPIVEAFVAAAGRKRGDLEWMTTASLPSLDATVGGKIIRGGTFMNQFCCLMCGVPYNQAWKFRGLTIQLIKDWYLSGSKPSQTIVSARLEQVTMRRSA